MSLLWLKLIAVLLVLITTILAGWYPLSRKKHSPHKLDFHSGEAFAVGVFLGAGLIHMLGESQRQFVKLGCHYPFALFLTGATFLFLLWLEHIWPGIL